MSASTELAFAWDESKNTANIRKHGFDFADAHLLFDHPLYTRADLSRDYGEERWVGVGMAHEQAAVIVFSQPTPNTIRVISLRKATRSERKAYEEKVQDELGTG